MTSGSASRVRVVANPQDVPSKDAPEEARVQRSRPLPQPALPVQDDDQTPGEPYRTIDRIREAVTAQASAGLSPASLALALFDWSIHLASAPGKRMELVEKAVRKSARFAAHVAASGVRTDLRPCIEPLAGDDRFRADVWHKPPYCYWAQSFLLTQQWWHSATRGVPGVMPHHEDVVSFAARQMLDVFAPSNALFTNPEVMERTVATGGAKLLQGFQNLLEDAGRLALGEKPVGVEKFAVGRDVAVTPGKVVYRNHLIELIQYSPATDTVSAEPVLIVPAWIMKYYILDLSPGNSLIRYLVGQGHTVFCISWRNPTADDRDLGMDEYRRDGIMAALDVVSEILPGRKIHGTGYCLGGTMLSIAAAAMARDGDDRLATLTLLAAQTDFTEPGELALFIDHSQMHFLDSMMWNRGYLSADQMAGAFQLLRSNDLIWSRMVHDYLMGERRPMIDLMAWNADSTRMPYRMHAEYLKRLYLDNELAAGCFMVEGRSIALQNIRVPMFVVGTERDHVAPWRSVYKIHQLSDTDVTFVLTSGGHNAGIVSEPGHPRRYFRMALKRTQDLEKSPSEWVETASEHEGSWWTEWSAWLDEYSAPQRVPPPPMGRKGRQPLCDAPGTYVMQR